MSEQINEANKPKDLDLLNKMKKLPADWLSSRWCWRC